MGAVTMDNAKIFSQLMSKSRSLAKISERRLQPLLVRNLDRKLGFSTLLQGQKGGRGAWHRAPPLRAPMITSTYTEPKSNHFHTNRIDSEFRQSFS